MQRFVPDAFAGRPSTMATDVGLLILRLAIAAVFVRHGWSDVFESGVSTNVQNYADAGIPLAGLSAPFAAYMQLLGGFLVAVGALTRPVSLGLTIVMAGALVFVHRGESLVMGQDGSGSGYAFIMCCLLYTSPSPRDRTRSRMPSSA